MSGMEPIGKPGFQPIQPPDDTKGKKDNDEVTKKQAAQAYQQALVLSLAQQIVNQLKQQQHIFSQAQSQD